jgi:hypothetical protein
MQIEPFIPEPENVPGKGRPTAWPFEKMDKGDSFYVPKTRLKALRTAVWRRKIKHGEDFIIGMHKNKWRCWRTA